MRKNLPVYFCVLFVLLIGFFSYLHAANSGIPGGEAEAEFDVVSGVSSEGMYMETSSENWNENITEPLDTGYYAFKTEEEFYSFAKTDPVVRAYLEPKAKNGVVKLYAPETVPEVFTLSQIICSYGSVSYEYTSPDPVNERLREVVRAHRENPDAPLI